MRINASEGAPRLKLPQDPLSPRRVPGLRRRCTVELELLRKHWGLCLGV